MDDTQNGQSTFGTVAQAVAELDRRDAAANPEQSTDDVEDAEVAEVVDEQPNESPDEGDEGDAQEQDGEEKKKDVIEFAGKSYAIPPGTPPELAAEVETLGKNLQADYTRQTQEIAQQRQVNQQVAQEYLTRIQGYQEQAQVLAQMAQAILGEEPDISLIQSDPQEYMLRKELRKKREGMFNSLLEQSRDAKAEADMLAQQQHMVALQQEIPMLLKAMPELQTEKGYREFQEKAINVGKRYGFSPEEIKGLSDHRMALALRDLAKLEQFEKGAKTFQEKRNNVPPRVLKPGAQTQDGGKAARAEEAKRQFLKSKRSDRDLRRWAEQTS